jgi:hypothetical protein
MKVVYEFISIVVGNSVCKAPCSANLASVETPVDRAWRHLSDILSSSRMDGMAEQIESRNSAAYLNQPFPNKLSLQHTMFTQFDQCRGAGGSSGVIVV